MKALELSLIGVGVSKALQAKMKIIQLLLFLCVVGLLMLGCDKAKNLCTSDFVGTYISKYSHGIETLVLNADGTYLQSYVGYSASVTETNSGNWKFFPGSEPEPFLSLDDALMFDTGWNEPRNPRTRSGHALNVLIWRGGQIELVINGDEGLGYRMQPKKQSTSVKH